MAQDPQRSVHGQIVQETMETFVPHFTVLLREVTGKGNVSSLVGGFLLGIIATTIGTLL